MGGRLFGTGEQCEWVKMLLQDDHSESGRCLDLKM